MQAHSGELLFLVLGQRQARIARIGGRSENGPSRALVGAWPPQAERARPVGCDVRYDPVFRSYSSFICSLVLSVSFVALSLKR
jgi:hypothetical protein